MSGGNAKAFADRFGATSDNPAIGSLAPELARILARRTHRAYADQPVPQDLMEALLAVSLSASSKSDFQEASIIVVNDRSLRADIGRHFPAMPWIGTSPRFLVFCGDSLRLEKLGALRGHHQTNRNLEGFLNASVDAALAMQTFILAAEMAGLGCCPISVIRNKMPDIAQLLGLPDGVFPVAGLCVGYPAGAGHVSMRLPMSVTIHHDRYDDSELASEVDAYDKRREAVNPTAPDRQRDPARFGTASAYGWSEDKARQAAQPEGAAFAKHISDTGFDMA
jgi:FMN reductase [NAD(P)H]